MYGRRVADVGVGLSIVFIIVGHGDVLRLFQLLFVVAGFMADVIFSTINCTLKLYFGLGTRGAWAYELNITVLYTSTK